MATPTYELIETTTLSSSASSVTFSSITQDYRDLVLVVDKPSGDIRTSLRFNSDTSSSYDLVSAQGDGSSTASYKSTQTYIWAPLFNSGGDVRSLVIFNIMDYSQTDRHKAVLSRYGAASSRVAMDAGRWANTSAITSIQVLPTLPAGSILSLYGITSEVV